MDKNSGLLGYFKDNYLKNQDKLDIVNIGYSKHDYAYLFNEPNWSYNILNSNENLNEDIIFVNDINYWIEVEDESYDVVFSKDYLVNLKYFWLVMFQMERILKSNGYLCIIVPNYCSNVQSLSFSNLFTLKSLKSLAEYVNLNVLEIFEKDSELCLITQKNSVVKQLSLNSQENKIFKNKCDVALEEYDLKLIEFEKINNEFHNSIDNYDALTSNLDDVVLKNINSNLEKIKSFNLKLIGILYEIRYNLLEFNTSTHVYCPICQKVHNIFSPHNTPFRLNAQCPNCFSLEKHRFLFLFLQNNSKLYEENINLLHFEPDASLYNFFNSLKNINYFPVGKELKFTVDLVVDFENNDFKDNSYDIIIFDYSIINDYEENYNILKKMYQIIKFYNDGGFVLIYLSEWDYKDKHDITNFKNLLHDIGFDLEIFSCENCVEKELMDIYGIFSERIFILKKF